MKLFSSSKQFIFLLPLVLFSNTLFLVVSLPLHSCMNTVNYTSNSTYQRNLNALLTSLPSNTDEYGFSNSANGIDSDRAYAKAYCDVDIELGICRYCINETAAQLVQRCPGYKNAVMLSERCSLTYSGEAVTGVIVDGPMFAALNVQDVESGDQFNQDLRSLMDSLRDKAASGGSLLKYATADTPGPDFMTIYGYVQCTPDLSEDQCKQCLQGLIRYIGECCNKKRGARIFNPSCKLRYEGYPFFNESAVVAHAPPPDTSSEQTPPPPQPPPDTGTVVAGKKSNTTVIVMVAVAVSLSFLVAVCILIFLRSKKRKKQNEDVRSMDEISHVDTLLYDFATIRDATNGFSDANKLGEGGFGVVYKGKLPSGEKIAVKRLTRNSGHGLEQFKNEVVLMVKLQHRNLVRLLGFCLEGTERLLIYEFVINSSLDNFIFDVSKRANLDWEKRQRIVEGVARGILYLHEDSKLRIIHRDLKASNILLDAKMNPKIADFGTARLFEFDETQANTRKIAGTYGYMAPEYVRGGHISVKLDVFSFGVLILEILSGQKNNCVRNGEIMESLLSLAWKNWRKGTPLNVIDHLLKRGSYPVSDMIRCIHIGLLCVQENAARRPTMASVVLMLGSSSVTLPVPSRPAFLVHNGSSVHMSLDESRSGGCRSNQPSNAEVSISQLHPR